MKKALLVFGFLSSVSLISEGNCSVDCKFDCTAKLGAKSDITEGSMEFNKIKLCLRTCKTKSYTGSLDKIKNFLGALLKNGTLSDAVYQEFAKSFVDYKDQHNAVDDLKVLKGTEPSKLFDAIEKEADKYDVLKGVNRQIDAMSVKR